MDQIIGRGDMHEHFGITRAEKYRVRQQVDKLDAPLVVGRIPVFGHTVHITRNKQ
jgi:hypothetical protein